jgi:hypothetical protein
MTPFEVMYDHRCRTHLNWIEPSQRTIFDPDLVTKAEKLVHCIQFNLKGAKSRQESYDNKRHRLLELEAGDHVYLRVSPTQDVKRFGIKGKLEPRCIGLFLVLARLGVVVYQLELPPSLADVHNMFHVSQLRKYLKSPVEVADNDVVPPDADLSYPEHLVKLLGQQDRVMRRQTIHFYKVQWSCHSEKELTWETEEFLRSNNLDFLPPR